MELYYWYERVLHGVILLVCERVLHGVILLV